MIARSTTLLAAAWLLASCAASPPPRPVDGIVSDASVNGGAPEATRKINVPAICPDCDQGARLFARRTVAKAVEDAYALPGGQTILIQDAGYPNGEKISKHVGHRSGTVVDFTVPLETGRLIANTDDPLGYEIRFDERGRRLDKPGQIDWDALAAQILALNTAVSSAGLCIQKIIFAPDLQKHLFATSVGAKLETITFSTDPKANRHDNHYHANILMNCP